jgi:N-acetyl-anhydromuramyl-L-alanine amidase AmpD
MYDVPAAEIRQANNLPPNPVLRKGAKLHIPNAAPVQPVISLYPSNVWTHIIIHHSATDEGDSLLFDKAHLHKGWDGVGYHFIINNGTKGHADGQIEVSPRWLKQVPGAHCKAGGMNERAIGICLVGNFNTDRPSAKQMRALAELVRKLKEYYRVPVSHIKGHGKVPGAKTDCPGKQFPWDTFSRRLSSNK